MDDHGWVPVSLIASFRRVSFCFDISFSLLTFIVLIAFEPLDEFIFLYCFATSHYLCLNGKALYR